MFCFLFALLLLSVMTASGCNLIILQISQYIYDNNDNDDDKEEVLR